MEHATTSSVNTVKKHRTNQANRTPSGYLAGRIKQLLLLITCRLFLLHIWCQSTFMSSRAQLKFMSFLYRLHPASWITAGSLSSTEVVSLPHFPSSPHPHPHPHPGLWRPHEQIEGECNNEQQTERGGEGLVSRRGHEDVLVLVDADHVVGDGGIVDVVPGDGPYRWRNSWCESLIRQFYLGRLINNPY